MQRRGWLFLLGYALIILTAISLLFRLSHGKKSVEIQMGQESHLELTCQLLAETWRGDPVYELENHSDETLAHITVLSFSEQHLPILWLGPQNQQHSIEQTSPVSPPVDLQAHQALLFAGPQTENRISLRSFKIEWLKDGNGQSESVQPIH